MKKYISFGSSVSEEQY